MNANEISEQIANKIKAIFPESFVSVRFTSNLYPMITLRFAKGKDKTEWCNGIIENDPAFMMFFVEGFDKEGNPADTIRLEVRQNRLHRSIPLRGKTATAEKIILYIENYFKKILDKI